MNPKIKRKWTKALNSNSYRQTKGELQKGGAYCCLGVLCDLYRKEHSIKDSITGLSDDVQNGLPNTEVLRWAGLTVKSAQALARLNDAGSKFYEISDYIMRKYK